MKTEDITRLSDAVGGLCKRFDALVTKRRDSKRSDARELQERKVGSWTIRETRQGYYDVFSPKSNGTYVKTSMREAEEFAKLHTDGRVDSARGDAGEITVGGRELKKVPTSMLKIARDESSDQKVKDAISKELKDRAINGGKRSDAGGSVSYKDFMIEEEEDSDKFEVWDPEDMEFYGRFATMAQAKSWIDQLMAKRKK